MSLMWTPRTEDDYNHLKGFDVYSSDNEKVGTIREVLHPAGEAAEQIGGHYFKVEPGLLKDLFGADEIYVPEHAVSTINPSENSVMLGVSKDLVQQQDWGKPRGTEGYRHA